MVFAPAVLTDDREARPGLLCQETRSQDQRQCFWPAAPAEGGLMSLSFAMTRLCHRKLVCLPVQGSGEEKKQESSDFHFLSFFPH